MKRKLTSVRGRGAKIKGSRAEIQWRDELRRIYPADKRDKIKRVPMSGASWMKGDVVDLNDYDTLYEVKNCEKLQIPMWWRQTLREAGNNRTPVLAITQNYRPFYVLLEPATADCLIKRSSFDIAHSRGLWCDSSTKLLDAIDRLEHYETLLVNLKKSDIELVAMRGDLYIEMKKVVYNFFTGSRE